MRPPVIVDVDPWGEGPEWMYVVAFQIGIATGPVLGGTLRDLLGPPAAIAASVALAVAGAILTANLGTGRASTRSGWSRNHRPRVRGHE